jgi:ribonuclease HII
MLDLAEEKILFDNNYKLVAGIDEAGRGPLAGPVVAVCCVIGPDFKLDKEELCFINDSKKLTHKKREEMFDVIQDSNIETGVGVCDNETIDRINILQATFLAMKKAISGLRNRPDYLLVDGKFGIPNSSYIQKPVIKGDEKVFSIAAASIIAKVTRDRMMMEIHKKYPQYGFDKHKGYGTKLHMEQLKKYGPSFIHRKSFGPCKGLILI